MESRAEQRREAPKPEFDVENALNDAEFLRFLAKYPDSESLVEGEANAAEIEKRFEAYRAKDIAVEELQKLYQKEIYQDCGVELNARDLVGIRSAIEREAIEHPERVRGLLEEARLFRELPQKIAEADREMQDIIERERAKFGDRDSLAEVQGTLVTVEQMQGSEKDLPLIGGLFRSREESDARKKVVEEYKLELREVSSQLDRLEKEFATIDELQALRSAVHAQYTRVREFFFHEFEPAETITKQARQRVQARLRDLADPEKDLSTLDRAQQDFDKLKGEDGELQLDYLRGMNRERYQQELDKALEARIAQDMRDAVEGVSLGNGALTRLEGALRSYLERGRLGSKEMGGVRDFLRKTFTEFAASDIEKEKKILLKYILLRI